MRSSPAAPIRSPWHSILVPELRLGDVASRSPVLNNRNGLAKQSSTKTALPSWLVTRG